jgi:ATP-dependent protease ClpP protease subunit
MPRRARKPAIKKSRKRTSVDANEDGNGVPLQPRGWYENGDYDRISINYDGDLRRDDRIVHLYGPIGQGYADEYPHYVTALEVTQRVVELVRDNRHEAIYALVNSPGGEVYDGLGIIDAFDMARQHGVKVVTRCQGEAQSMAADILILGGDLRSISPNSFIMTHGDIDKTMRFGDMLDIESEIRLRSITTNRLLDLYAKKTKKPRTFWESMFKDSRPVYWTPQEALDAGLVDSVY